MKLAIIGGGAAGMSLVSFLAGQANETKMPEMDLFEASDQTLRKVRASGNGRCNFTNKNMGGEFYTGSEKDFVKHGLDTFSYEEACEFFRTLGLPHRSLESGMTYPATMRADSLCQALEAQVKHSNCKMHLGREIVEVNKNFQGFYLLAKPGQGGEAEEYGPFDAVALASGGAYGIGKKERSCGYSLVKNFGHSISPLHAGIVGLSVKEKEFCKKLSGEKIIAGLSYGAKYLEDDLLFTDYGLSGMAVLRASNEILDGLEKQNSFTINVDLIPQIGEKALFEELSLLFKNRGNWSLTDCLQGYLHRNILNESLKKIGIEPESKVSIMDDQSLKSWIDRVKSLEFTVPGPRKKDRGQVTCGGILCSGVDPLSLESKLCENLYFAGEVLNVQGVCGGYNLHWAWTSARLIAQSIKRKLQ